MASSQTTTAKNAQRSAVITVPSNQDHGAQDSVEIDRQLQCSNAVELQSDRTLTESYEHHGTNESTTVIGDPATPHTQSQYLTGAEDQDKDTVLEYPAGTADAHATAMSSRVIGEMTAIRTMDRSLGCVPLTRATIAAHEHYLAHNLSLDEAQKPGRIDAVVRAARQLGIELPRECFESEERDLDQWVEVQSHLCGHE